MNEEFVWVFNGHRNHYPSGVFTTREKAEEWINKHKLEGTLTAYPLDISVYDWAIEKSYFKPKKPEHTEAYWIANFSHAAQEHYHFENEGDDES